MKKLFAILICSFALLSVSCGSGQQNSADQEQADKSGPEYTSKYICPMHCEGSGSDEPGACPVCGMEYVENKDAEHGDEGHMENGSMDHEEGEHMDHMNGDESESDSSGN